MRPLNSAIAAGLAVLAASAGTAAAQPPASPGASCVALITSYEATQLQPGSVGAEVSALAADGRLGSTLVAPLAQRHLGSLESCAEAER
jgi:hypothetical protein